MLAAGSYTAAVKPSTGPPTAAAAAGAAPGCVLTPEQTEGPYYIAKSLVRNDITEGRPGTPLQLNLTVQNAATCQPIPNATAPPPLGSVVGAARPIDPGGPCSPLKSPTRLLDSCQDAERVAFSIAPRLPSSGPW
ncbi:MAG: hypothetical protein HY329_16570 [Chloroflexi bacterium]|nr:hypothetical protein [Chloroflexota bacterium]